MNKQQIQSFIEKMKMVISEMETTINTDDKIIKPEDYHFNDTGETIHAGQPVNICKCCGNIKKPTTKADNGHYYCNSCINDISGNIHDVRRFCAICGNKLQGFYNVNSPDDLKCPGCINSLQKEGAVINDGEI